MAELTGAALVARVLGALQEMEQVALLRPITKGAWSVVETRQIPEVLATSIRTAPTARPGPVFVEIPVDLLLDRVEDRLAPVPAGSVHRPRIAADRADVERLAQLLASAERPLVVAGSGVYWDDAAASLRALVERGGLPVVTNGAGRGTVPTDHPLAVATARGFALGSADGGARPRRAARLPPRLWPPADLRRGRPAGDGGLRPGRARAGPGAGAGLGEVWCLNVLLDPAAYRRTGQVSMAI